MTVVLGFIKKEIIQLLRNPALLFALLITPLIQTAILHKSLSSTPQNIHFYVDAKANDYVMAKIREKAKASKWFADVQPSMEKPFRLLQQGKADMVMIAPPKGFSRSLGNKEGSLQVLIDASNVVKAQAMEQYARALTMKAVAESRLIMPEPVNGVNFKTRLLYNPEMDTNFFLLPFLVAVLTGSSIVVLIGDSMSREKEQGTFETLISAPIEMYHIVLGKTVPFLLVAIINMLSLLAEAMIVFHVPFVGSFFQMMLVYFLFAVSMSTFSVWLSTYCSTQKQNMLATMMFLMVTMMLAGGMAPVDNMPLMLRFLAQFNPMYHYSEIFRSLLLKGCEWSYLIEHVIPICLFGIIFAFLAKKRFKTTL